MLPLPFAFVFLGFVQHAAVLPTGRRTDLPRLGLRPIALPPPPRRWVPCICCSGGRVGGRVGGRAEDADSKPVSQSKERGAPWHPVQKAAAVLVPAVVLAAACLLRSFAVAANGLTARAAGASLRGILQPTCHKTRLV